MRPRIPCKGVLALMLSYLVFVMSVGLKMARNTTEWLVITSPLTLLVIGYIVCVMGEVVGYKDSQESRRRCSCGDFLRDFGSVLSFWGLVIIAIGASVVVLAKLPSINVTLVPEPLKRGVRIEVGEFMVLLGALYSITAVLFFILDSRFYQKKPRG